MKNGEIIHRFQVLEGFESTSADGPIRAALSSETPVSRMFGKEILSHSRDAIDMSDVREHGIPLTIGHSERDPFSQTLPIGRVRELTVDKGVMRGSLYFDSDEMGVAARGKVERGIAPDVSLTYRVLDHEQTGDGETTITRWAPLAASIVTLPADASVGVGRSVELADKGDSDVETTSETTPATESNIIDKIQSRKAAGYASGEAAGRKQVAEIYSRALELKRMQPDKASDLDELVTAVVANDGECTLSRFNELALDLLLPAATPLAKEGPATSVPRVVSRDGGGMRIESGGLDVTENAFRGICDSLLERAVPGSVKAEDMTGNQYRGWPMLDLAREILTLRGHNVRGRSSEQIAKMAIGMRAIDPGTADYATTDFPGVTENIGYKAALEGFNRAEVSWNRWCGTGSVPDFKQFSLPRLSHTSKLPIVAENAQYQSLTRTDEREYGQAEKRGGVISYTWEAVLNNDVNSFADQMMSSGESANATLDKDVYDLLLLNQIVGASGPVMRDTNQLFSAAHNNVITTALSLAGIVAARVAMGRQTDDNTEEIAPQLRYVLVPLELQDEAINLAGSEYLVDTGGAAQRANTVRNTFEPIATHWLTDVTDWFAASRSGQHVQVMFLNGVQTPTIEQETGWSTDALHYKVRFVYDVVARDWRGMIWAEVAG